MIHILLKKGSGEEATISFKEIFDWLILIDEAIIPERVKPKKDAGDLPASLSAFGLFEKSGCQKRIRTGWPIGVTL